MGIILVGYLLSGCLLTTHRRVASPGRDGDITSGWARLILQDRCRRARDTFSGRKFSKFSDVFLPCTISGTPRVVGIVICCKLAALETAVAATWAGGVGALELGIRVIRGGGQGRCQRRCSRCCNRHFG